MMTIRDRISEKFKELFSCSGTVYMSAGRINLIGEHTDYNGGFVFPGAIDKGIWVEMKPNGGKNVRVYSLDFGEYSEFGMNEEDAPFRSWARYVFGVCREIIKRGYAFGGFDAVFAGDVPLGAGLSSSAALESAFGFGINDMYSLGISMFDLALTGQATEHNYCGVNCGIMDQFASIFGKAGNLMRLDCMTLEYEYYPFKPRGYRLVLLDSAVKHELVGSPYNKRRESCERVAAKLGRKFLRGATMDELDAVRKDISGEDYRRARYVIGEERRVLAVCDALQHNDYETVGRMMYETHRGMRDDYEVSCEELDYLNDMAAECGVTGSRIMGGGFGGCTINLVKDNVYPVFTDKAVASFEARYGHAPKVYDVVISDGARRVE